MSTVVPQPAATVMVIRPGRSPFEVLMLRRSLESEFVRGAYVFPGGGVDTADGEDEMLDRCTGRTDAEASASLGLPSGGLAYWVSAFRECFEEAGVLVATGPHGDPASFDDPAVDARFVGHRRALNAGERSFLDICRAEDLTLPADLVHYVSHWITPEGQPRRFDTRFFVTVAPSGQAATHDEVETIDHMWVTPAEALAQEAAGKIELVVPTVWHLRLLARFATRADLLAAMSNLSTVPTIEPELVVDHRGRRQIVVPIQPDEVGAGRPPVPPS